MAFNLASFAAALVLTLLSIFPIPSTGQDKEDPCSHRVCMWGEMCQADSAGYTYCECPWNCPDVYEPVCSVYGIQFTSKCQLHMFACTEGVNIAIKNIGPCENKTEVEPEPDPRTQVCPTTDQMVDFRNRFLEWMYITKLQSGRSAEELEHFKLEKRIYDLSLQEKVDVAQWEFRQCDVDANNALEGAELDAILQMMMYEPCGTGLLQSCDLDSKDGITRSEWKMCFNLAERAPFKGRRLHKQ